MSRSLRRGALAATVLTLSIASLSACAAGNTAQTLEIHPDNAGTAVGDIKVQNAAVVTQPDLASVGPAVVTATLFNNGSTDQTVESITVGSGTRAKLKAAGGSGPVTVPAGGSIVIGGKGNASAVLASGREAVKDGDAQGVTFTFSRTGKVSLDAFVVPAKSAFKDYGPVVVPAPKPTGSPSPTAPEAGEHGGEAEAGAGEHGAGH